MTQLMPQDFVGRWRLSRRIDDRVMRQEGELEGEAVLTALADGTLDYHEAGELRFGDGAPMEATRAYRWVWGDGGVAVTFSDGRPFHGFVPMGQAEGTDHPCGADLYRVQYDFTDWPKWRATWTVKGPRKNYTSVSDYAPA